MSNEKKKQAKTKSEIGRSSKRRGKTAENELAKIFRENVPECAADRANARRSVQYNGRAVEGLPDIIGTPLLSVESKHCERVNIREWIQQAIETAKEGEIPIVCHKKSHCKPNWLVTISLTDFLKLYRAFLEKEGVPDGK